MSEDSQPSELLNLLRTRSGGPGSVVHLATLGTWLSKEGVSSKDLPGGGLKAFLALNPDFAKVKGAATREVVEFGESEPPPLPLAAARQRRASQLALDHSLWQAFVSDNEDRAWYIDLAELAVVQAAVIDGQAGAPVAAEPHRYIRIPTLPTSEQQQHARDFLDPHLGRQRAEHLTSTPTWLGRVRDVLNDDLLQQLLDDRRRWVVRHARTWLEEHDLPKGRFVYERRSAAGGSQPSNRTDRLRTAIHTAIDRMSEAELERLAIPARLLLD